MCLWDVIKVKYALTFYRLLKGSCVQTGELKYERPRIQVSYECATSV